MLTENKLSSKEIEIIWAATKKGDLEGKLTILKMLKEISHNFGYDHIKYLLNNIYSSFTDDLLTEEVEVSK